MTFCFLTTVTSQGSFGQHCSDSGCCIQGLCLLAEQLTPHLRMSQVGKQTFAMVPASSCPTTLHNDLYRPKSPRKRYPPWHTTRTKYLTQHREIYMVFTKKYSNILSVILSGIYSAIFSDILSASILIFFSGILSDMYFVTFFRYLVFGPRRNPQEQTGTTGKEGGEEVREWRSEAQRVATGGSNQETFTLEVTKKWWHGTCF